MIQETETVVQTSAKPKPECLCVITADLDCPGVPLHSEFVPALYGHIFWTCKYTPGRGSRLEHLQVLLLGDFLLTPLEVNNTPTHDEKPGLNKQINYTILFSNWIAGRVQAIQQNWNYAQGWNNCDINNHSVYFNTRNLWGWKRQSPWLDGLFFNTWQYQVHFQHAFLQIIKDFSKNSLYVLLNW